VFDHGGDPMHSIYFFQRLYQGIVLMQNCLPEIIVSRVQGAYRDQNGEFYTSFHWVPVSLQPGSYWLKGSVYNVKSPLHEISFLIPVSFWFFA
jgi:hypothetical protein